MSQNQQSAVERGAASVTKWIGSTTSVILHTILFIVSFTLPLIGVVSFERMLLVLTTIVSLEAIYLSIFIQMSINMSNQSIESIQEDIEDLGEEIEDLGEDIEEIGEDIDEIQKDVDEIQKDVDEIQKDVDEIQEDVDEIQEETGHEHVIEKKEAEILLSIQTTLIHLQKEIEQLKNSGK